VRIEFTYARPSEYFAELMSPAVTRAIRRRLAVSGLLLLAILLAAALIGGYVGLLLVVGGVIGTAVGMVLLRQRYRAAMRVPKSFLAPRRYLITDEAVESTSDSTSVRWSWDAVRSATVMTDVVIIGQDGGVVFDIPRAAMTPEQEQELLDFVDARGIGSRPVSPGRTRRH